MRSLKRLDVFPKFDTKFEQDARQRTAIGGVFSIVAIAILTVLVVSEVRYFLSIVEEHEMFVDPVLGGDMEITANVTFPHVPCDFLTADVIDSFGSFVEDSDRHVQKTRVEAETLTHISAARPIVDEKKKITKAIDPSGAEKENCPSCYGAELSPGDCCYTCEDVREAYRRRRWNFNFDDISVLQCAEERLRNAAALGGREGCNVYTRYRVARVAGNLHFIPGRMFDFGGHHMHDFMGATIAALNLSHVFHAFDFGERFPGQINPMEGLVNARAKGTEANGRFTYSVKIVPTRYQAASVLGTGDVVESNQYSVTHHFTERGIKEDKQSMAPGIFVSYDLSPIKVHVTEEHPYSSIMHLVLQLCTVCGGVFTVAGILDSMLFHGIRRVQRKMREGKQF